MFCRGDVMKVAIYSRKSVFTGKGESIENQIEMCKDYYCKMYGTEDEFVIYEDEGFSGGNINRPRFQELLKDIVSNKFKALICYRLDRISRNVADFSKTLELLNDHNVSFISIREQFDTSTPIGRAMVYISSVFAQLERETIAERIRDNMLELSKTGRWLGGQTPLGFNSEKFVYIDEDFKERSLSKLTPVDEEMKIVNFIFSKYLSKGSIHMVLKELLATSTKGKNGGEFASMSIDDILRNPVYVQSDETIKEFFVNKGITFCGEPKGNGIMLYNKRSSKNKYRDITEWIASVAKHQGVISSSDWIKVQQNLDKNSKKANPRQGTSKRALLTGVLKCAKCGAPMRVSYGRVKPDGTKNHYYMCNMKAHSCGSRCNNPNANGTLMDNDVIVALLHYNEETLLKKFQEQAASYKDISIENSFENIDNNINNLKINADNIISQLSKTSNSTTQNLLLGKIDAISNEIDELKLKRTAAHTKKEESSMNLDNIKIVMDSFSDFIKLCKSIKNLESIEDENIRIALRNLIDRIVNKITYDGETNEVSIDIWGI